jgi:ribosomal protein S18 acetylase RimI-like enzyme
MSGPLKNVREWLLDQAIAVAAWRDKRILERDSLKMCWRVSPVPTPTVKPPYELMDSSGGDVRPDWIETMNDAGMRTSGASWSREFDRVGAKVFTVRSNDQIVAAAGIRPVVDYSAAGHMLWVAVRPQHQGQRLGRAVVLAAMAHANDRYDDVVLLTNDERQTAIQMYFKLGFRACLNSWDRTHHYRWNRIARQLKCQILYCRDPRHKPVIERMSL